MKNAKICKKGQMIIKGKCVTQKGTVTKNLPDIRGSTTLDKIANFYKDLGWDGNSKVEPGKVVVNEDDWLKLIGKIKTRYSDEDKRLRAAFTFTNYGPSGSNKVKRGKVKLKKGWVY